MNKMRLVLFTIIFAIFAAPAFAQTQEVYSPESDEAMRTAFAFYQGKNPEQALEYCKKALALNPRDRRAYVLSAYVYAEQDKLKEASDAVSKAIKIDPTDKEIYLLKAQFDKLRDAYPEALASVRKAIDLDPKYAEAHLLLGKLLENKVSESAKAIAAFQTALSINPKLFEAHEALGELFAYKEDWKSAEENYKKSIELDPKHMAGRWSLGRILLKQKRLAEARELWESRTSDEDDTMPKFIVQLQWAENLKRATDAVAQHPDDPVALVDLGFAVMQGPSWVMDFRQERAIVHFKKALQLKPDFARAQYGIVKAQIELRSINPENNKKLDVELAKLRKLDPKLADEMVQYRKTYQGELIAVPPSKPE